MTPSQPHRPVPTPGDGRAGERAVGPSLAAERAATERVGPVQYRDSYESPYEIIREALAAAHDPALGEDRSVNLGDVLRILRAACSHGKGEYGRAADFLESLASDNEGLSASLRAADDDLSAGRTTSLADLRAELNEGKADGNGG